ncbi:MAG: hypothetical protein ACODAE_04925 [Gemmatimonadota bacterium]
MTVMPETIAIAAERAAAAAADLDSADAVIARREAGGAGPGEDARVESCVAELLRDQDGDGSWGAELVPTAEALILLHELMHGAIAGRSAGAETVEPSEALTRARAAAVPAVERGVAWLRGRRGRPGRYGEGCSPERHREGLCHHFSGGFFSPGPPEIDQSGLRLGVGVEIDDDGEARLAASCVALRALLRWGALTTDARLHLDTLHRLILRWRRWEHGRPGPAAALAMMAAALEAPPDDTAGHDAIEHGLGLIAGSQRADGSWPGADTFQVLETLLAARRRGFRNDRLEATLLRGAGLLASTQSVEDGTWGRETSPRRLRIGWAALRIAGELDPVAARGRPAGD